MAVAFLVVMRTRPAGPSGLSPSRSAGLDKSSSTTTHGWLVSASQVRKRPATVSASPAGSAAVALTAASTKADRTDARLVAAAQISRSTLPECHSHSAEDAASCVLPHASSQAPDRPGVGRPGASTTVAPGTSADSRAAAVSGLALKPSASAGTAPARTRSPVGTCLPPSRYALPAAVRTNAAGRDGEPSRSRPGLPETIILGVTLHRSCCHAGVPERYRTRRYDRAHLVTVLPCGSTWSRRGRTPIPGGAPPRSRDQPRLVQEHATGDRIRTVFARSVTVASAPGEGDIIRPGSAGPPPFC